MSYPKILIHHGKHGDRYILARHQNEEQQAWLTMFESLDQWECFYEDLEDDELEWHRQAKNGNWKAAKWLLESRSYGEYENVSVESIDTPETLFDKLDS